MMNRHDAPNNNSGQNSLLIEIATRNALSLPVDNGIGEAARIMAQRRISSIVVTDNSNHPLGIVTERNILHAMQAGCPQDTNLRDIMSSPVITVPPSITTLDAYQLCLRNGIRHLVIVDESGLLAGVVSETDFRLHLNLTALAGRRKVVSIAKRSAVVLPPTSSLMQSLDLMQAQHKSCVVVVENEKPVGIITERDVVRFYSGDKSYADIMLGEVMVAPVLTISSEATTNQAAEMMLARKVRHLVVVDESGRMVGLLSEHDMTQAMVIGLADERNGLEENFLRTLVNTLPDLIWLKDTGGIYLACNARFERFLGAKEQDIVGKSDFDFMSEKLAGFFRDHDRMAMEAGKPTLNEEWLTFADDGHRELLETIKTPMRDGQGKLIGVLGIARDISARNQTEQHLKQMLEFTEGVINAIPDLLFELDREGRYLNIWAHDPELLAAQRDLLLGRTVNEMLPADAAAIVMSAIAGAAATGYSNGQIIHLDLPHGESWFELSTAAKTVADASTRHFIMLSRDVTERKRAEAQKENFLSLLNATLESSADAILVVDLDNQWVLHNRRFIELWHITEEMISSKDDRAALNYVLDQLQDPDGFLKKVTELYATPEESSFDIFNFKDGKIVERYSIPQHVEGKVVGRVWSFRDVTKREYAGIALREREEIFRSIVNQAADSILLLDAESMRFVEFNPLAHKSLGYTREEFAQLTLVDVQAQYNAQQVHGILDAAASSGLPLQIETQHKRKDGSIRMTQVSSRAITMHGKKYFSSIWSDITERKQAELKLQQSEAHFRFITESAQALIWMADTHKLCTWFNKVWLDFTGCTLEQEMGDGWAEGVHPEDRQRCYEMYASHFDCREPFNMEYRLRRHDGEYRWIVDNGAPRFDAKGNFEGYIGSCFDITERKGAEESLRITASVFDTSQEAILITDASNAISDVNPAFTRITGYSREEVLGRNPKLLSSGRHDQAFYAAMWQSLNQNRSWRGEVWNRRKSGETYAEMLSISVICDNNGKVLRHVGLFSDISHLKEHEAELNRVAHYDALTGIPNRLLLADRMRHAIAQTAREQNMMAVCYLDLDGFKLINDTIGHEAGDHVLIEIAKRIKDTIRGGDTVARLGGDEFVVLLLGLEKGEECVATLERLLTSISQPILVKNQLYTLSASIGVSIYPLDDEDPDTLLRHADQAMYVVKQSGKDRFHIYDPALDLRARSHHEFLRSIRHGLERGQFELHYQPKINLRSKRMVGAEALIRWRHPERGLLFPAEFLRLVENTELDIEIGNWVIATALEQIALWRHAGLDIEVSINISAYHLESPHFTEKLRQKLARHPDLPPGKFQIEVLETAALEDIDIVRKIIATCGKLGVRFALDDFGTGYSSLSYLSSLPVDVLKIDQSFVRDMLEDKGDMAIVQGIIALARAFERETVAEGIETAAHYQALLDMGCELGQGYGIARPMPAHELTKWRIA
ncbi:MAG: PAS domain S-box protein [Nitrosomonadales bacterium]|nr:PAS domain S-box protein [Nitrosomonadales bacterium]